MESLVSVIGKSHMTTGKWLKSNKNYMGRIRMMGDPTGKKNLSGNVKHTVGVGRMKPDVSRESDT